MRKLIIGFILGIILCSGVVYAANYYAKDVTYISDDEKWKVSNVNEALDSLYEIGKNSGPKEIYIPRISYQNGYKSSGNTSYLDMVRGYTEIDVTGYSTLTVASIVSTADYSTTAADIIGFDSEGNQTTLHSGVTNDMITLDITNYVKIEFHGETRAKTGYKELTFNEIHIK